MHLNQTLQELLLKKIEQSLFNIDISQSIKEEIAQSTYVDILEFLHEHNICKIHGYTPAQHPFSDNETFIADEKENSISEDD